MGGDRWYYIQADRYAQNWLNCDTTAAGVEDVNVEWAARHCKHIPPEGVIPPSGGKGWGNSFDIPDKKNAPFHVNYPMWFEYPNRVAPDCLCPEKKTPEGGSQICGRRVVQCGNFFCDYPSPTKSWSWGFFNYSSPEYCMKLDVIIDRPLGTVCLEHDHCAVGLQCSDGVCSTCPDDACPDRTQSDKLSAWERLANTVNIDVTIMSALGRVRGVVQLT